VDEIVAGPYFLLLREAPPLNGDDKGNGFVAEKGSDPTKGRSGVCEGELKVFIFSLTLVLDEADKRDALSG